jgi:hypothetical protein
MWFLALASVVISGVLVALSTCPGMLEQIPGRPVKIAGIAIAVVAGLLALWHLFRPARPNRPRRRTSALVVLVAAIATPILLTAHAPRRVVFGNYRPQFEALLANAPPPGDRATVNLNAELTIYWVDQWGTDTRGGTYFRTLTAAGPDQRSFGFAYRPNAEGSPFGDAGYELQHLTGDWYSFAASDR